MDLTFHNILLVIYNLNALICQLLELIMNGKYDYIKAEENKYVNPKFIRWIQQTNDCYNICSKSTGCALDDTHKICKFNNPTSYNKINELINR